MFKKFKKFITPKKPVFNFYRRIESIEYNPPYKKIKDFLGNDCPIFKKSKVVAHIGQGSYGQAFLVTYEPPSSSFYGNMTFVVKFQQHRQNTTSVVIDQHYFISELNITSAINEVFDEKLSICFFPTFIAGECRALGEYRNKNEMTGFYTAMEYIVSSPPESQQSESITLYGGIQKRMFNPRELDFMFCAIVHAIGAMQTKKIVHNDLHPGNVFIQHRRSSSTIKSYPPSLVFYNRDYERYEEDMTYIPKIADWGFAQQFNERGELIHNSQWMSRHRRRSYFTPTHDILQLFNTLLTFFVYPIFFKSGTLVLRRIDELGSNFQRSFNNIIPLLTCFMSKRYTYFFQRFFISPVVDIYSIEKIDKFISEWLFDNNSHNLISLLHIDDHSPPIESKNVGKRVVRLIIRMFIIFSFYNTIIKGQLVDTIREMNLFNPTLERSLMDTRKRLTPGGALEELESRDAPVLAVVEEYDDEDGDDSYVQKNKKNDYGKSNVTDKRVRVIKNLLKLELSPSHHTTTPQLDSSPPPLKQKEEEEVQSVVIDTMFDTLSRVFDAEAETPLPPPPPPPSLPTRQEQEQEREPQPAPPQAAWNAGLPEVTLPKLNAFPPIRKDQLPQLKEQPSSEYHDYDDDDDDEDDDDADSDIEEDIPPLATRRR